MYVPISTMDYAIVIDEPLFNATDQPEIKVRHPQVNSPIIKHIPKSARTACANFLIYILKLNKYDPNDSTTWMLLLYFAR